MNKAKILFFFNWLCKKWWPVLLGVILIFALVIRVWGVTRFPPSLYWEEAALGYDAFSILKTGKDHHGNSFPIVAFPSFGDYKPSLYFYALVPSIAVFGLTAFAVRLPSILAGVLLVVGVGAITSRLTQQRELQLWAMFITAVSPWAIIFSRAGWEVNLATALVCWAVYFGFPRKKIQFFQIVISMILFGLSMYAYHATRLIAPFLGIALLLAQLLTLLELKRVSWKSFFEKLRLLFLAGMVFVVVISPLLLSMGNNSTQQRFAETNIFSDQQIIVQSNLAKELSGNTLVSKIIFHRYRFFATTFVENYLRHFSLQFWLISGDNNPRHSVQFFGLLYPFEALFFLAGCWYLVKNWKPYFILLPFWFLLGLVPASLTKAAPHALRILPVLPVVMIILAMGVQEVLTAVLPQKFSLLKRSGVLILYLGAFCIFWRFYSVVYPQLYASEWQYGYQQMVYALQEVQRQHPDQMTFVTREYGRPAMYYWFFTQTNPSEVQRAESTAKKDQGEFLEFQQMKFIRSVDEVGASEGIVVSSPAEKERLAVQHRNIQLLNSISDLQGKVVWQIYLVTKD